MSKRSRSQDEGAMIDRHLREGGGVRGFPHRYPTVDAHFVLVDPDFFEHALSSAVVVVVVVFAALAVSLRGW